LREPQGCLRSWWACVIDRSEDRSIPQTTWIAHLPPVHRVSMSYTPSRLSDYSLFKELDGFPSKTTRAAFRHNCRESFISDEFCSRQGTGDITVASRVVNRCRKLLLATFSRRVIRFRSRGGGIYRSFPPCQLVSSTSLSQSQHRETLRLRNLTLRRRRNDGR
jgi:hypothetical protein